MAQVKTLDEWRLEQKALRTLPLDSSELERSRGQGLLTEDDYETYVRCYSEVDPIYALCWIIGINMCQVPLLVKEKQGEEWVDAEDSTLAELLHFVNNSDTWTDLLYATIVDLLLTGNAYWDLEYDAGARGAKGQKPPSELYWLPSYRTTPIPGTKQLYDGFIYQSTTGSQESITFQPWEVFYVKTHNPQSRFVGVGPLRPLAGKIEIEVQSTTWMRSFYKHGAYPGVVMTTDKELGRGISRDDLKAAHEEFKDAHQGASKAFKPKFLTGGMKVQTITLNPDQAQPLAAHDAALKAMCRTLNVPPIMVGIWEGGSRALFEQQERSFWRNCIQPWWGLLAKADGSGALNEKFVTMWASEGEFRVWPDWSVVGALKADEVALATATQALLPTLTRNEIRAKYHDAPPLRGGDIIWENGKPVAWTKEAEPQALAILAAMAQPAFGGAPPLKAWLGYKALPEGEQRHPFSVTSTRQSTSGRRSLGLTNRKPTLRAE